MNSITIHGKILVKEKLVNLANCKPFAKIFPVNIHRYTENVLWHMHWLLLICQPDLTNQGELSPSVRVFVAPSALQVIRPLWSYRWSCTETTHKPHNTELIELPNLNVLTALSPIPFEDGIYRNSDMTNMILLGEFGKLWVCEWWVKQWQLECHVWQIRFVRVRQC